MIIPVENKTQYQVLLNNAKIVLGSDDKKFLPELKFGKWGDEAWFKIYDEDGFSTTNQEVYENGIVSLDCGNIIHKYYEDIYNQLEYQIIVKSHPGTSSIKLKCDFSPGLTFAKQTTLEKEWENNPGFWKEYPTAKDYMKFTVRPENVINSFACYGNKKNGIYQSGKFFHLYRFWCMDAKNKFEWADVIIDDSNKIVEIIPENNFFSTAVFPVIIGPTIGYSSAGASTYGSATVKMASWSEATDTGITDTWHVAVAAIDGANPGLKLCIYETTTAYTPVPYSPRNKNLVEQVEFDVSVSNDNSAAASGQTLNSGSFYSLGFIVESSTTKVKYDAAAANQNAYVTGLTYGTEMAANWGNSASYGTNIWSIWVDYGGVVTNAPTGNLSGPLTGIFGGVL